MLTGTVLPAHPKPLPNEVLSSWFARVAEANAVKQHSLAFMRIGAQKPPWSWNLDLEGGEWFWQRLCEVTGTDLNVGRGTTLLGYADVVFPSQAKSKRRLWILPNRTSQSKLITDGIQFCPVCLSEGELSYYRRQWRLAFFTFCPIHKVMLYDACPLCGAPIAYHRRDCSVEVGATKSLGYCYNCLGDLRAVGKIRPESDYSKVFERHCDILTNFQMNHTTRYDLNFFEVLHQLCMILVSARNQGKLRAFICSRSGIPDKPSAERRTPFFWRGLETRHHIISLALWLLLDPVRLTDAWKSGAVRYSSLLRDFSHAPQWFQSFTDKMNRQRAKLRDTKRINFQ